MKTRILWMGAALLVLLTLGAVALAQSGDGYDLTWNTIDGGGVTFASGGGYSLGGTAGQAEAGVLSGGDFTLSGGFWRGWAVAATAYVVYLPLVVRP